MSKLTISHDVAQVDNFIADISSNAVSHYVVAAKHSAWADDNNPPATNTSVSSIEHSIYTDLIFGKRIEADDVVAAVKRYDWTANTVYAMYDDIDSSLYDKQFYVMTDENNVYKCIYNNDGTASTEKPVTTSEEIFETSDRYKWKYMYTVSSQDIDEFATEDYIPVRTNANVASLAVPGTIDFIKVTNNGYDYRTYHRGVVSYVSNSQLIGIEQTASPEDDFYNGSAMYLIAGLGAGQLRKIKDYDGSQRLVLLETPFDSYGVITISNPTGSIAAEQVIRQDYSTMSTVDLVGYFAREGNAGALGSIKQTDTGAVGVIGFANTTGIIAQVIGATQFSGLEYPILNADDGGSQIKGVVSTTNQYSANVTANSAVIACNVAGGFFNTVNASAVLVGTTVTGTGFANSATILTANASHIIVDTVSTETQTGVTLTLLNKKLLFGVGASNLPGLVGNTSFDTELSERGYVRIGTDISKNVRKIETIASPNVLRVTYQYVNDPASGYVYKIDNAFTVGTLSTVQANGIITSVNLDAMTVELANIVGTFVTGEEILLVDDDLVSVGYRAVISYISSLQNNNLSMIVTSVTNQNAFYNYDLKIKGLNSGAVADITFAKLLPSVTYQETGGKILQGLSFNTYADFSSSTVLGSAMIIGKTFIPDTSTQYYISPYVNITGDGTGAIAYSTVDPVANTISRVDVLDPGVGYTKAMVSITANTLYGTTATARPIISPLDGHGSYPQVELGGRYVCVSTDFLNIGNELYKFPGYGEFRQIGILKDPRYKELFLNYTTRYSANLQLSSVTGTLNVGDKIAQGETGAIGTIKTVSGSNVVVVDIMGTFDAAASPDTVTTYPEGATANVGVVTLNYPANTTLVTQSSTGATANVVGAYPASNYLKVTNVKGKFLAAGSGVDTTIDTTLANAATNVDVIKINNNSLDVSGSYYSRFNQLARVSLSSTSGNFENLAEVIQTSTNATGIVYDTENELDLEVDSVVGTFVVGAVVTDQTTLANGHILYANTTYLKLTSVSGSFEVGSTVTTPTGASAAVTNVYPVLVLSNVSENFAQGNSSIYLKQTKFANGATSTGVIGYNNNANTVVFPDLIRNTGEILYIENMQPVTRSKTSKESFRLIIKM